ncbi:hypothetical protein [uncultured Jatrophihabitans sp.]|uniref:hypothetical protein n=1 Tax=uncultured Jatrophihabitans sp. TaxID=1610747 RepID=UPI0035CA16A5
MTDLHAETPAASAPGGRARGAAQVDASLLASLVTVLVAAGGLAAASRLSAVALLVAAGVVQAGFALSWVLATGMPGRKGAIVLAALGAAGADVVVSVWPHGRLGTLLAVLGLAVPAMFVHQLARGAARTRLVESLSFVALLVVCVVALPALLQLRHEFATPRLGGIVVTAVVGAVGGALVVGYLVDLVFPAPRFDAEVPRGMLALLAATVVGGAVGYLALKSHAEFADGRAVFVGAALGAVAAFLAVGAAFVLHSVPAATTRSASVTRPVCAALLPLCLLAPGAFLLCLAVRT